MRSLFLIAPTLVLWPSLAAAQPIPCFESTAIPPWSAVGVEAGFSGSRPLTGGQAVELCSQSDGLDSTYDSYHGLVRGVTGDYVLSTAVLDVAPDSVAGLIVSRDTQSPDVAHLFIVAERLGSGPTVLVRSGLRAVRGAQSSPIDSVPVEVALPVTLQITRAGDVLTTWVVQGGQELVHLTVPTAGTELTGWAQAGAVQAGRSKLVESRAIVEVPTLTTSFTPPPDVDCTGDTTLAQSGGAFTLTGFGFDQVTAARVGAVALPIVRNTEDALMISLPAAPTGTVGPLSLSVAGAEHVTSRTFAFGGAAFVRGDLTGNGVVDADDLRALRRVLRGGALPDCRATADIDANGTVDAADESRLSGFLAGRRGALPPEGPFPAPGVVRGVQACGLPSGPVVARLTTIDGAPLPRVLATGDVVRIEGSGLPSTPVVRFGDVATRVLPGSGATHVDVVLGVATSSARRCLVVQRGGARRAGESVFGLAYGVDAAARPDLCIDVAASRLGFGAVATAASDGRIFLPIDPATWSPERTLRVNVELALPLVEGTSRGPRSATFLFTHDPRGSGPARVSYGAWLTALAKRTTEVLGASDDCDCEVEVIAEPSAGGLWLLPCFATTPAPPEPPLPPGTLPGGLPLLPVKPSLGTASAFAPPPAPSCAGLAGGGTPRQIAWCHLAQITAVRDVLVDPVNDHESYLGLPLWEGFRPMATLSVLEGIQNPDWTIDPRDQSPDFKRTMVETAMSEHMISRDYFDACGIAARAHYCGQEVPKTWMPALPPGSRVVKAFWRPLSELPASVDPAQFYSYDPPGYPRQYLVGLNVSVATGNSMGDDSYLEWATFWMPRPQGDTLTKGGEALSKYYNEDCFVGGPQDRPAELAGTVWGNYHLCTQDGDTEHCGNPWGPKNECLPNPGPTLDPTNQEGCEGCHAAQGTFTWTEGAPIADDARACMSVILAQQAKGKHPYQSGASCEIF
ncbi:dockerin type I repeat-containing protein [Myxococcota bacterium]|nr:dockerin type I repeat-containing protein [Myxococcota bacterium]